MNKHYPRRASFAAFALLIFALATVPVPSAAELDPVLSYGDVSGRSGACSDALDALASEAGGLTIAEAYLRVIEANTICDGPSSTSSTGASPEGATRLLSGSAVEPSLGAEDDGCRGLYVGTLVSICRALNFELPAGCELQLRTIASDASSLGAGCIDAAVEGQVLDTLETAWDALPEVIGLDLAADVCDGAGAGTASGSISIAGLSYPTADEVAAGEMSSGTLDKLKGNGPTYGFAGTDDAATIKVIALVLPAVDPSASVDCKTLVTKVCLVDSWEWTCKKVRSVVVDSGDGDGSLISGGTVAFDVHVHLKGGA